MLRHVWLPLAALCLVHLTACAAERVPLKDIGRSVKMKILVDKVMQPTRNWITEEWMIKETADAGFNVFSPRRGAEDLAEVRKVTEWCRKYGIYHQPWMRGVQGVPEDKALSDGKRMVWASGAEQMLWSPNSDELWEWMASYIVPYAEISAQDETLMGVFLDYENYWPGGRGNLYELSYDDLIMEKFAAHKKLTLPELEFGARKAWLEEQKLHDEFSVFQIAHWRQKCRELRQAVDKHNPRFMFNIYPAPGTMFMIEACYPEWATKQAPLILADPWTYGRSGRYTSHEVALKNNEAIMKRGIAVAKEKGINYIYIGGIDPVVKGADPEFSGKNALLVSGLSDGYWIFYEGPVYDKDHPEYFKWFTWANNKMDSRDFKAAWEPRETEDPWGFPKITVSGQPLPRTQMREFPEVRLRGSNALLVSGHKGTALQVDLQVFRVGRNDSPLRWTIKDQQWNDLVTGEIPVGEGTVRYTPKDDAVLVLLLEAAGNACAVKQANAALAIFAEPSARLIYGAERLYFKVPQELKEFEVILSGGTGIENAKLMLFDPSGAEVASKETTEKENRVNIKAVPGEHAGKVWAVKIDRAAEGAFEDNAITLAKPMPQVLSYFEDEVFEVETGR